MAGILLAQATWPEALERYLLQEVLWVDPARVRLPRSLPVALVWEKGRVRGTVDLPTGRFLVTLRVKPLADRAWKWAVEGLAQRPEANQALLAGRLDPVVIQVFEEANASLFVSATRRVECSCKGVADCRHRLAVVAQMAAEAAENPFLWLTVLGREREELLGALRVALMEELPEDEAEGLDRGRFWGPVGAPRAGDAVGARGAGTPAATVPALANPAVPLETAAALATLVEQLGRFPLVDGPMLVANRGGRQGVVNYRSLTEFLQLYARQVAEGARALQADARIIPAPAPPAPQPEAPPPKARKRRYGRRHR